MTSKVSPSSVTSSAPASSTASEDVVLGGALGGDDDDALAREVVGDAAGVGHGAAVAGHERAHLGGGAVLVVGEALDQQGDAVGAVALVHDGRVLDGLAGEAGAALDGAVDVVVRDRGLLGLLHGVDEGRVAGEVGAAHLGGDLDVLDELGERLRTARR